MSWYSSPGTIDANAQGLWGWLNLAAGDGLRLPNPMTRGIVVRRHDTSRKAAA